MIDIKLKDGQTGYDAVGEYIHRYWNHNITDDVIVSIGISRDGETYELRKEVASPMGFSDIEFLYDWWEGEDSLRYSGLRQLTNLISTVGYILMNNERMIV